MSAASVLSEAAANARVADYHVALWTSVLLIAVLFAVVYFVRGLKRNAGAPPSASSQRARARGVCVCCCTFLRLRLPQSARVSRPATPRHATPPAQQPAASPPLPPRRLTSPPPFHPLPPFPPRLQMRDMGSAPLDSQLRAQVADKRSGGVGGARAGEDAKRK